MGVMIIVYHGITFHYVFFSTALDSADVASNDSANSAALVTSIRATILSAV